MVQWLALLVLRRCSEQGISVQTLDLDVVAVNVSVNGCLSQCVSPVINRRLNQVYAATEGGGGEEGWSNKYRNINNITFTVV